MKDSSSLLKILVFLIVRKLDTFRQIIKLVLKNAMSLKELIIQTTTNVKFAESKHVVSAISAISPELKSVHNVSNHDSFNWI